MSSSNLLIRLIRTTGSSKEDDRIKISRVDSTTFRLTYNYGFAIGVGAKPCSIECNADTIFRWLRTTIQLLEHDDDPFESLQLESQLLPSVLVLIKRLDRAYDAIMDAVEFQLNNWPEDPMPPLVPVKNIWSNAGVSKKVSNNWNKAAFEEDEDEYTNLMRACNDTRAEEFEKEVEEHTNYLISQANPPLGQSQPLATETPA